MLAGLPGLSGMVRTLAGVLRAPACFGGDTMKKFLLLGLLCLQVVAQTPVTPVVGPTTPVVTPASVATPQEVPVAKPAQPLLPWFGVTSAEKVRVRSGPGDVHAILRELPKQTPLRALTREGDWMSVEVPGGLAVFVATSLGGKNYVSEAQTGEGVVLVDDLMIRAEPNATSPFLGKLNTSDRIVIIDRKGEFARVLAPASVKAWVYAAYVTHVADQAAAETDFVAAHRKAEESLLKTGEESRALVAREAERRRLAADADKAFTTFEDEARKPMDRRDISAVRKALQGARDLTPAGSPHRDRAEQLLGTVDSWDKARTEIAAAKLRVEEALRMKAAADQKYARDLAALRKAREEEEARNRLGGANKPFIETGHLRANIPVVGGVIDNETPWALWQADLRRLLLFSTRYDLSEYNGRLVGVVAGDGPSADGGRAVRRIAVTKIEILN